MGNIDILLKELKHDAKQETSLGQCRSEDCHNGTHVTLLIIMFLMVALGIMAGFAMMEAEKLEEKRQGLLLELEAERARNDALLEERQRRIEELEEENRELQEVIKQGIDEIRGILSGARVVEFEATAYTHVAIPGVADINGTGDGITASGLPVQEGIVAVDPRIIPLGTRIWVEGFGILIAADTGGAIRGDRLDIFLSSRGDALRFGRQQVRGIILN